MYIGDHARERPDHPAVIDAATGEALTYRELDDRSNRLAQLLHAEGLRRGDTVALFMENNIRFLEVAWAALRSGLYLTAVNRYLTADEAAYIINDCDARVLVSSDAKAATAAELPARLPGCRRFLMTDGAILGWESYEAGIAAFPPERLAEERAGELMLYSWTVISCAEWLERPGSVGRARIGVIHICDENGAEVPAGEDGLVYFERDVMPFAYHKDPERTRAAQHPTHPNWSALGDIGHLDEAGYLFLTDRKAFMIISGGVNIYPREIEDVLIGHPKVRDVAVFGMPDAEMGERVAAVIEPAVEPSPALAAELSAYAALHLARYKLPKTIDFTAALPRLPTGKLYKKALRDDYLARLGA